MPAYVGGGGTPPSPYTGKYYTNYSAPPRPRGPWPIRRVRQVARGDTLPRAVPGTPGTGTFPIGACYCIG